MMEPGVSVHCSCVQDALSELYNPAPSPAVPHLATPPFSMMPPGSTMTHPNGLGTMRLSDETAGLLAGSCARFAHMLRLRPQ